MIYNQSFTHTDHIEFPGSMLFAIDKMNEIKSAEGSSKPCLITVLARENHCPTLKLSAQSHQKVKQVKDSQPILGSLLSEIGASNIHLSCICLGSKFQLTGITQDIENT